MVACPDVDGWDAMNGDGVGTHHQAEVALRQIDHGGVEVGTLVEGGRDDRGREGRRGLYKTLMLAPDRSRDHQYSCHACLVFPQKPVHNMDRQSYNLGEVEGGI